MKSSLNDQTLFVSLKIFYFLLFIGQKYYLMRYYIMIFVLIPRNSPAKYAEVCPVNLD